MLPIIIVFLEGHILSILGFVLALLLMSRLMDDNPNPGSAFAWLLGFVFVPYITIPLYLVMGGRKFRRMAGRKKALSFQRCELIPPAKELDDVANTLIALDDAPAACGGNHVEPLPSGRGDYHRLMKSINEAKESINICVFIIAAKDHVADTIIAALARKAKEGVKVRVLVDALGSFWSTGRVLQPLRDAGGDVATFMPVIPTRQRWSANLRNHRKIFIFDERLAIVGGRNVGSEYMGPDADPNRWRDYAVVVEGPVVHTLMQVFAADWEFAMGETPPQIVKKTEAEDFPPVGNVTIQTIASGPDIPGEPLYEGLLTAMFRARKRIWIITPYLVPDETILQTLCVLAKTGRDVQLIVPLKTDLKLMDFARRYPLRELHRAGVKIWLYRPRMVHAKMMIVDDNTLMTGSANLDHRSLYLNYEICLFLYSKEQAKEAERYFLRLREETVAYSRRRLKRFRRPMAETLENLSRLLSPLL